MRLIPASRPALGRVAMVMVLCWLASGTALAKTVNLVNSRNGLAAAIKEAGPGGTVTLRGVIREEQAVEIPHRIHLRGLGENRQLPTLIIAPTDRLNAIVVLADDVRISGLNIQPSSELYGNLGTAFFVIGADFSMGSCQVAGWRVGVFLSGAEAAVLAKNTFLGSPLNRDPDWLGAAVYSQFCVKRTAIGNNTISGFHVGAYIQDTAEYVLNQNDLSENTIGLWFDGAVDSLLSHNSIARSGQAAILLSESASKNAVSNNIVTGSAGDSIVAEGSTSENLIRSNRVDKPVRNFGQNTVLSTTIQSYHPRDRLQDDDDDDGEDDDD